jgi:hypothetical protein
MEDTLLEEGNGPSYLASSVTHRFSSVVTVVFIFRTLRASSTFTEAPSSRPDHQPTPSSTHSHLQAHSPHLVIYTMKIAAAATLAFAASASAFAPASVQVSSFLASVLAWLTRLRLLRR